MLADKEMERHATGAVGLACANCKAAAGVTVHRGRSLCRQCYESNVWPWDRVARSSGQQISIATVGDADTVLAHLRTYVGQNWESHYESVFRRLLANHSEGTPAGWTWNWPAALAPIWFLYRRLYTPFLGFVALTALVRAVDAMVSGSSQAAFLVALLYVGQAILMGYVADRLLFKRAYWAVTNVPIDADPDSLRQAGKPLKWVAWLIPTVIGVGIASTILIPLLAR